MKTALMIAGICGALALAGCTTQNQGGMGNEYDTDSQTVYHGTPDNSNTMSPSTDPRGGFQNWRYEGGIDRSEPHPSTLPPQ